MDANHGEPVLVVLLVPGLDIGQRADAVDAGVGPEVDEDDLPPELVEAQRLVAGGVEPVLGPGEVRRLEVHGQALAGRRLAGARLVRHRPAAMERREVARDARALLDAAGRIDQRGGEVAGDGALEADVEVGDHHDGDSDHHGAHHHLDAGAQGAEVVRDPPAAEHQQVEHDRRPDRVGERHREPADREVLRGGDGDHPGEDRAGTRRVHQAEAGAEQHPTTEPVPPGARGLGDDAGDPRLEPVRQRLHAQEDAEDQQRHDRQDAREVVGQPQCLDHVHEGDRREGERQRESERHAERPPAASGHARGQDGRQDRQHAR